MHRRTLIIAVLSLSMMLMSGAAAWANPCADNAYGISTLRGDAQYPPGWVSGFEPIEISPPDEFVYGVIDGAVLPQQFAFIKAKLRSRLDRQIGSGTLVAAARYRKRIDYQPDLSTDPPTAESRESSFSASLSAALPIDGIPSDSQQTFTFNFSNDPIPAGITDLYLIVTFQGEIEGIESPAVIASIKDLNEPTHITVWNLWDYFAFWGEPRTVESILNNQADYDMALNLCEASARVYIRSNIIFTSVYLGFHPDIITETPIYVVKYNDLYPGHYGRIIALLDGSFYIYRQNYWVDGCTVGNMESLPLIPTSCKPGRAGAHSVAINQEGTQGFSAHPIKTARQRITTHVISGWNGYCPYDGGGLFQRFLDIFHREIPPASDEPESATIINFP